MRTISLKISPTFPKSREQFCPKRSFQKNRFALRASRTSETKSLKTLYERAKSEIEMRQMTRKSNQVFAGIAGSVFGCGIYLAKLFLDFQIFSWSSLSIFAGIAATLGLLIHPIFHFFSRKKTYLYQLQSEVSKNQARLFLFPLMKLQKEVAKAKQHFYNLLEKPSPEMQAQLDQIKREFGLTAEHQPWLSEWSEDILNGKIILFGIIPTSIETYLDRFLGMDSETRQKEFLAITSSVQKYSVVDFYQTFRNDGRVYLYLKKMRQSKSQPNPEP